MPLYNFDYSSKPINNCVNGEAKHTYAGVSALDHTKRSVTALIKRPLALQNTLRSNTSHKNAINIGRIPV